MEKYVYKFTNEIKKGEWTTLRLSEKLEFETILMLAAGFIGTKQSNVRIHFEFWKGQKIEILGEEEYTKWFNLMEKNTF